MSFPYFWNSPFQVDTGANGNHPSVTVLTDGRQVVAWRDGTLGSARLRYMILNADGTVAKADADLNSDTTGNIGTSTEGEMQIAALSNGGFVSVWNHRVGADDSISFRIFDANGNAVGADKTISHPNVNGTDVRPTVTALANGGFIVGWEGYSLTAGHQIWTERFDAAGAAVSAPFMSSDAWAGDGDPSIDRYAATQDTVVVWQDSFGNNGSNGGIWGNFDGFTFRIDAASNAQGNPGNSDPEVAFDGLGHFFTAWSQHLGGVNYALYGTLDVQGSSSFQINTAAVGSDMLPQVVGLKGGGWLVVWTIPYVNSQTEIRGQLITSAGALSGTEFQIASGITSLNTLDAEALPDGRVMVTWEAGGAHTFAEYIDLRSGMVTWSGSAGNDQYAGTIYGDILNGLGGNDYINGWSGNDNMSGGGGIDTINGGVGTDTLIETTGSPFTLIHTSQVGNGWTISSVGVVDYVSNVEAAALNGGLLTLRQSHSNFNFADANDAGATSDILLLNGGSLVNWTVQSNAVAAGTLVGTGLTGWSIKATGDTNADGDVDIIMQNGGSIVAWNMQNGALASAALLGTAVGWTVVGAADINNDGDQDIILQNGGTIVSWNMQNGAVASGALLGSGVTGWAVVGTGDFFGDGSSDVLLQNGGSLVVWNIVNGAVASGVLLGGGLTGWSVKATGDLNGDGTTDIVLQNGGTIVDWIINNGAVTAGHSLGSGLTGWKVVASGDYNGDGTSDILLQNGGSIVTWNMLNGVVSGGVLTAGGATGWVVVA